MKSYSLLFHTLYDEETPVGNLGRGTHYSILAAVQWLDKKQNPRTYPGIQRFAVIWDEDHDERVIEVIERAYMSEIFAPVLYIGERKGTLTVLVDAEFYDIIQGDWVSYHLAWSDICSEVCGDKWIFDKIKVVGTKETGIINDEDAKVSTYLSNIDNLWSLGWNEYRHPRVQEYLPLSIRQGGTYQAYLRHGPS